MGLEFLEECYAPTPALTCNQRIGRALPGATPAADPDSRGTFGPFSEAHHHTYPTPGNTEAGNIQVRRRHTAEKDFGWEAGSHPKKGEGSHPQAGITPDGAGQATSKSRPGLTGMYP